MATVEQWKVHELEITNDQVAYANPYYDVDVTAVFTGPNGESLSRPAYWKGGLTWGIRFAPTSIGSWSYTVCCNDKANTGFDAIGGSFTCTEYTGNQEIYQKGFLKTASGRRFLYYADGTPFFWLGDTHWNMYCYERINESNKEGYASQFYGMVDKRVAQRFTVYQTNLMGNINLTEDGSGFFVAGSDYTEINLDFFENDTDVKAKYLADNGLVNAVGFMWNDKIDTLGDKALRFAYYIVARYGAYPTVWTIGGEVPGYNSEQRVEAWRKVGEGVYAWDSYGHPITTHNPNERPLPDYYVSEPWHSFSMGQMGHGENDMHVQNYRDFIARHPNVPYVEGEAMYTGLNSLEYIGRRKIDDQVTLNVAYRAMQTGCCGFGLGVQGIWNATWDSASLTNPLYIFWGTQDWRDGIDLSIGDHLALMREFYEALAWDHLEPRQDIITSSLSDPELLNASATPDMSTIVIYAPDSLQWISYSVSGLTAGDQYSAESFNPLTGEYAALPPITADADGAAVLPRVGSLPSQGWLLLLKRI